MSTSHKLIFDRCVPASKIDDLNGVLISFLDNLLNSCDCDLYVNSGFRSESYEHSKGRTGTSSHCKGLAVDIHCANSSLRYLLVKNAIYYGCQRIGIGRTFIHLDFDFSKSPAIWHYYNSK